ncbi:MAG: hypothetical protein AAFR76_01535 [Planctomycetota bacterium]
MVEQARRVMILARLGELQLREPEHQLFRRAAEASQQLQWVASRWPLALARLWRPRCQRWLGLPEGEDPRPEGCGHELELLAPGQYTCPNPDCEMHGQIEARTSQRDAVAMALDVGLIAALIGGANRGGKTESVSQLAVAVAGGTDQWWVRSWLALNDLPPDAIQSGPGKVWMSALTFSDSVEYHRPKLDQYLPVGTERRNWRAENQARAILPHGGEITCKAEAQKRKKFQGSAKHLVILDEEHTEDIYEECLRATADLQGKVVLSMTPLMGVTWPHRIFIASPSPDVGERTILGLDNPHVPSRGLRKRFQNLQPERRDARLFGRWATAKGVIYPSFSRALHVVPRFPIPPEWKKYRCIDFGIWFACLWAAIDPNKDQLVVYRELKTYDVQLGSNARTVNALSGTERYAASLADPADKTARVKLRKQYNLHTRPAQKSIENGLDAVTERLAMTEQKYPRLVIFDDLVELLAELPLYKRDENGQIIKKNDHLCDDLRYICYHLERSSGRGVSLGTAER